ncbi:MAG TPA: type IV pilus secretin PilQ [Vicinamibacterales bacterium]|jgi:type IV pilus assembly protein PilQ|nr:type IV pilus secretin PilQ [Vicinamibacterales bacterium]
MVRHSMLLMLCAVVTAALAPLHASGAAHDPATLRKIASRVEERTGVITIEASQPVPYVASQPDAHTYLIELRDVLAADFADTFKADPRHPVGAVQVESAHAADGVSLVRVRMTLTQPVRPRVRSQRNVIYVEAERLDRQTSGRALVSAIGPASAIRDVRVTSRGSGATAITLFGTGRLVASNVAEAKDAPRLVIDMPNVTSALPGVTPIAQGPIDAVRIALNPEAPLVTRVVLDMNRRAPYRVEQPSDGQTLTVVFDEVAADPISALRPVAAQAAPSQPGARQPAAPPQAAAQKQAAPPQAVARQANRAPAAAPQQPATQPPVTPAPLQPPSRFTGHPVSLDFQGADLRAVLRTFAEISGLNVVIDPSIQGTVDVALRDVPWDQALDIILRANKLGYFVDGTIVRIAPLTVLADEEAQRRKLSEEQALAGELQVMTRALSYAKAEEVAPLLTRTVLSQRGQIQTDTRTNTLIINDLPERLKKAADLITTLDQAQPQVEIEARIVQTTREFARTIGVQWGVGGRAAVATGNTLPFSFPNQGSITGRTGAIQGDTAPSPQTDAVPTMVNLGVQGASSAIGLALGSINGAINLDVALSALERAGQGRLLSTPRVATQNNVEAEITQGVQIPIQTVANNTITVSFKDAALTLKVVPQITAANTVIMRITVENASPDFSRSVNNIPPIDTQRAITQVLVSNGDTTVIGGIYVSREQANQERTPALHRIPLLGWLFKREGITDESRELLIFITPRIVRL